MEMKVFVAEVYNNYTDLLLLIQNRYHNYIYEHTKLFKNK